MLPSPTRRRGLRSGRVGAALTAVPAPGIFIATALSTYMGAGFAVGLFGVMPPVTVAWWRVTIGALALLAWRRPWGDRLRGRGYAWTRRALGAAAAFGVATATMNVLFYASISYLPMGTAVSLEFLGPVIVAILTGRGWRPRIAAALAMAGVASISGVGLDISDPAHRAGMLLALAAGLAWACYILLGRRVATSGAGLDALAVGTAAGALFYTPLAAPTASGAFSSAGTAAAVVSTAPHAAMVEFGTSRMAARPHLLPAASAVREEFFAAARAEAQRSAREVWK